MINPLYLFLSSLLWTTALSHLWIETAEELVNFHIKGTTGNIWEPGQSWLLALRAQSCCVLSNSIKGNNVWACNLEKILYQHLEINQDQGTVWSVQPSLPWRAYGLSSGELTPCPARGHRGFRSSSCRKNFESQKLNQTDAVPPKIKTHCNTQQFWSFWQQLKTMEAMG